MRPDRLLGQPERRTPHRVLGTPRLTQCRGHLRGQPPELVRDDRAGTFQSLLEHRGPGGHRYQRQRLRALRQHRTAAGGQILHGRDPRNGLHGRTRQQLTYRVREIRERRVHIGVADRRERHRTMRTQQLRDPLTRRVPRRLPARPVRPLIQREHHTYDLVRRHVMQDGRLGPPRSPVSITGTTTTAAPRSAFTPLTVTSSGSPGPTPTPTSLLVP